MKVEIAGYNVDKTFLPEGTTPETISAAYARISRSPAPIIDLRREAIENLINVRRMNEQIVFDMGHSSIAEHAVFNIDITDISRLCLEELERHRLVSYTEKSQRYIKMNNIPSPYIKEFDDVNLYAEFDELFKFCLEVYQESGLPEEDARYFLPLSTPSQVGMTINARSAEHLIKALWASPLHEAHLLASQLYNELKNIAPSLIKHTIPDIMDMRNYGNPLRSKDCYPLVESQSKFPRHQIVFDNVYCGDLILFNHAIGGIDKEIIEQDLLKQGHSMETAQSTVFGMTPADVKSYIEHMMFGMTPFSTMPSSFEHIFTTWVMHLSAAAYGQLKRHRMVGISTSPYDITLGFTSPQIESKSVLTMTRDLRRESEMLYLNALAAGVDRNVAAYALLAGHRRQVVWTVNMKEFFHVSRLREDLHAQWDIRAFMKQIADTFRQTTVIGNYLGGKDAFAKESK